MLLFVLAAQAAAGPAAVPGGKQEPFLHSDFDLERVEPGGDEIVVTGRRQDQRLPPLPPVPEERLPRAETGIIGNLRGGVAVEQNALPGGVVSNRVMMKLKLPF